MKYLKMGDGPNYFREIVTLGKQLIEEDLISFQRDEGEFIKRMMRKRNEAILSDMVPF